VRYRAALTALGEAEDFHNSQPAFQWLPFRERLPNGTLEVRKQNTASMIEKDFNIAFVSDLALREKQIQQNYRPVIAVHKWFARRPGTLFRALILSEFGSGDLQHEFYESHNLADKHICDPFMGGGSPLLEANRLGCDVIGYDINPMSHWIVSEELSHIDLKAYRAAGARLRTALEKKIGHLYRTTCLCCGSKDANVKYFLWVKTQQCSNCETSVDLFPGQLVAEDVRHPKIVFVCADCGSLTESEDRKNPGSCSTCGKSLSSQGPAKRNRCECPKCHHTVKYPDITSGPLSHRLFAIEYHCTACKADHKGRFFKQPDQDDLKRVAEAECLRSKLKPEFIPTDAIPAGDETGRLHRWGYEFYHQMFNDRQLLGLELSCRLIDKEPSDRIRHALATNLSDLLRYQNMLCRYDTMALKSLDIFSVHGFPVGLVQCESNLLGIASVSREMSIGSGGWANILDKYAKAKAYCDEPFEIRHVNGRKVKVSIPGEWIGEHRNGSYEPESRNVDLRCADAAEAELLPESLDAVFTDPPYFGNVQYAELMDFCYVWLRRLAGEGKGCFEQGSTRNPAELTGNDNMNRGLDHFTQGLSQVFQRMANALKPGAPLAFTYHHNKIEAYHPIIVAILDANLICTDSIPCPAEMGASIHINGTGSSIIDTVFVCRKQKHVEVLPGAGIPERLKSDEEALRKGGVKVTTGDLRCMLFGQIARLAVQRLSADWDSRTDTFVKLRRVAEELKMIAEPLPATGVKEQPAENRTTSLEAIVT
jgi:adenine-specific DNA methylase